MQYYAIHVLLHPDFFQIKVMTLEKITSDVKNSKYCRIFFYKTLVVKYSLHSIQTFFKFLYNNIFYYDNIII